jgi:hypothetical protein
MAQIHLPFEKTDSYTTTFIRQHVNRRMRYILVASVILVLCINMVTFREHLPTPDAVLDTFHFLDHGATIQVALINAHHANDEVHTALYNALSQSRNINITRYQQTSSFGMDEVVSQLAHPPHSQWQPMSEFTRLSAHGPAPDIVVSTTCGNDFEQSPNEVSALKLDYARLLEHHNTHLICVMHQSNHFLDGFGFEVKSILKPWILAGRLDVVTLSPHVGEYFLENVYPLFWDDMDGKMPVMRDFVPVFPVSTSGPAEDNTLKLAIQGSFDHGHNYTSIFARFAEVKAEWEAVGQAEDAARVQLHIIGSGARPEVPDDVAGQILFHENLDYGEYYDILSTMDAILPAFAEENWAGNDYYRNIASSTIPASLIADVPLVADFKLMDAYSYLRLDMVWYRDDSEHEIDAAFRILQAGAAKQKAMRENIEKKRSELLQENYANVKEWTEEAFDKAQARLKGASMEMKARVDVEEVPVEEAHKFDPFPGRGGKNMRHGNRHG